MYAFGIPHSFIKRPVICGQRACQRLIQIGIAQIFLGDIYHGWEFILTDFTAVPLKKSRNMREIEINLGEIPAKSRSVK
jgi:hypothetical protein